MGKVEGSEEIAICPVVILESAFLRDVLIQSI